MGFGNPHVGNELKSDINVTPLVDVMLVLLIIFMVVTPMLQKGVGVALPQARNVRAVSEDRNQVLEVVLKDTGEMYVEGDPVNRAELERILRARLDANPTLELHLKGDRNVRYNRVKAIVLAAREAGFRDADLVAEEIRDVAPDEPAP